MGRTRTHGLIASNNEDERWEYRLAYPHYTELEENPSCIRVWNVKRILREVLYSAWERGQVTILTVGSYDTSCGKAELILR